MAIDQFVSAVWNHEMSVTSEAERKQRCRLYTRGELNRLVDNLCHPFYKEDKAFVLIDGLLHSLIEQNPPESALKFLRYNLPAIIGQTRTLSRSHKSRAKT